MHAHYELYDGASYTLIADALTEEEILAVLRATIAEHGEAAMNGLILLREDGRYVEGNKSLVAADGDLLQRARADADVASRR